MPCLDMLFVFQVVLANGDVVKTGSRARKSAAGCVLSSFSSCYHFLLVVFVLFDLFKKGNYIIEYARSRTSFLINSKVIFCDEICSKVIQYPSYLIYTYV